MPLENDVSEFKAWAIRIGCPPENVPTDQTLIKLYNSSQALALQNTINKVRSRQEVQSVRQNILLNSLKPFNGSLISIPIKHNLPPKAQVYIKTKQFQTKIQETEKRIDDIKCEIRKSQKILTEKNNQIQNTKGQLKKHEMRSSMFYVKQKNLQKLCENEKEATQKIKQIIPVQAKVTAVHEQEAQKAIIKCIDDLKIFYKLSRDSETSDKDSFWQCMRQILANIPRSILWTKLNRIKEEDLQTISTLADLNTSDLIQNSDTKITAFNTALHQAYAKNIGLHLDRKRLEQEKMTLRNGYISLFTNFSSAVEAKMIMYNQVEDNSELLNNFIIQYSSVSYCYGQFQFLKQEQERLKQLIRNNENKLDNHTNVIGTLKEIYGEIETIFMSTRHNIDSLPMIKDKIQKCEKYTKYLIDEKSIDHNDMKPSTSMESLLNSSSLNSFGSMSESVLCSTKLELDVTMRRDKKTVKHILPQYINELSLLMDVPLAQCDQLSGESQLALTNHSVYYSSAMPMQISLPMHAIFNYRPIPRAIFQEIRNKVHFYKQLEYSQQQTIVPPNIPKVKRSQLKQQLTEHSNRIEEFIDKIVLEMQNTNRMIADIQKYYKFLSENPLRKYISKTKLFDGRSFDEYEEEFLMYYIILKSNRS